MSQPKTIVIGGGVAGLVAADALATEGERVLVLEAGERLGGSVSAHDVAGLRLDAGAEAFATRTAVVSDLLADLGLGDEIVTPRPLGAWVQHAQGAWPLPLAGLLGIPADLDEPVLTEALGPDGLARAREDLTMPVAETEGPISLGALVRDRMGEEVLERLVAPVVGGVHAADPDQLDVQSVAPGLLAALAETGSLSAGAAHLRAAATAGSAVGSVRGGMHRMVDALAERIRSNGGRTETGKAVDSVLPTDDGWDVTVGGEHLSAERVLVATDADDAVRLLGPTLQSVAELGAGADRSASAPITLATLVVRSDRLDKWPRGTGVLVSGATANVRAKALTHANAKWEWLDDQLDPGTHVLRLSYGRPEEDASDYADDDVVLAQAGRDAAMILGVEPGELELAFDVVDADVVRWTGSLPVARVGHAARVAAVREAAMRLDGLAVTGGWLAGNGLAAVVADAQAQAAVLQGN